MMLPSTGARGPMFTLACTAGVVLIFLLGFMTWSTPERIPFPRGGGSTHVEMYVALPGSRASALLQWRAVVPERTCPEKLRALVDSY